MKKIGFICPLGKEGSETRIRSDEIMNSVIVPVANELGYTVQRPDQMSGTIIMSDIVDMIKNTDVLIADLTDNNPNVFYELGLRQAVKGKCINIVSDEWLKQLEENKSGLPFDISHFRAYRYKDISLTKNADRFRANIKRSISSLEKDPPAPIIIPTDEDLMNYYGKTVVAGFKKGRTDQYGLAKCLFNERCKKIFLMQRSSSLVLNAEQGWDTEKIFLSELRRALRTCDCFFHVISLEGIEAHINRKNSVFPDFKNFTRDLINANGTVAINVNREDNAKFVLKKLPKDDQNSFFKLDRQARVLITETESGIVNAVIVQNLGENQTTFQIIGPLAKEYLDTCIEFYNRCDYVEWNDIVLLYKKYQKIEEGRGKE